MELSTAPGGAGEQARPAGFDWGRLQGASLGQEPPAEGARIASRPAAPAGRAHWLHRAQGGGRGWMLGSRPRPSKSRPCLLPPYLDIDAGLIIMYSIAMPRRTTVEIDDALLREAQGALGTTGVKDTVEKAFREAIRRHLRDRLAERIEAGTGVDRSPELLAESRPPR